MEEYVDGIILVGVVIILWAIGIAVYKVIKEI